MKLETTSKQESDMPIRKLVVYDMQGKKIEELPSPFNGKVNNAALSQAVTMYLANQRSGLASTKTRGEVSGGGKKPWRQKGTGRARAGSTRSPLWRHGGVVFGPHPRDFHYTLAPKIRNLALYSALNEKTIQDNIIVLDKLEMPEAKTKAFKTILDNLKVKEKAVIVLLAAEKNLERAGRNIPQVKLALAKNLNALDVVKAKKIIVLKDALKVVEERLPTAGRHSL